MKKLYTLLLLAASALPALAAPVTPAQALGRLQTSPVRKARALVTDRPQLVAELPELYVFSSAKGFMVLPADDVAEPLLAFGADSYDSANPLLKFWLDTYAAEIRAARGVAADPGPQTVMRRSRPAIEPMTTTRWNQGAPYNDLCPTLQGERCVTGCVATAMSQCMRFHSWPAKGTGTHEYTWTDGNQTLSFDYGATTFEWNLMPDVYDSSSTADQKKAVATLMYAAGVSVDMSYTPSESGAVSRNMGRAFLENFGYDKGLWMPQRDFYGLAEWEDMIYDELAEGRPVLYGGTGAAGGHQFIADGYSAEGYFHFNWGWGGMSDGYFLLTALDPPALGIGGGAGGFNYNQSALLGLQPPVSGGEAKYVMYCTGQFEPAEAQTTLGSRAAFGGGFFNYSFTATPADTHIGVKIARADGSGTPVYVTSGSGAIQPEYGARELSVTIPADLAEGSYVITPAYQIPGHDWEEMRAPLSSNGSVTATVSGNNVTFSTPSAPEISVTDLTMASPLYWSKPFAMTFTVTNVRDTEYYGGLTPILLAADESAIVAEAAPYPIDIEGGDSQTAQYSGTFSARSVPAPGTYKLALFNAATEQLACEPIEVTLKAAPAATSISVTDLKLLSPTPIKDRSAIRFSATVTCTRGYFAEELKLPVFPSTGGSNVAMGSSKPLYLESGQSENVELTLDLSSLPAGAYEIAAYYGQNPVSDYVSFELPADTTGINETGADASPARFYDLQGRPAAPSRHGVYISTRGTKVLF